MSKHSDHIKAFGVERLRRLEGMVCCIYNFFGWKWDWIWRYHWCMRVEDFLVGDLDLHWIRRVEEGGVLTEAFERGAFALQIHGYD